MNRPSVSKITSRVPTLRSRRDLGRLSASLGDQVDLASTHRAAEERLRPAWADYTATVSTPEMAVSLKLAGLLDSLIQLNEPARVADLGSGFSSFVARTAGTGRQVVASVDDSEEWLGATARFLSSHGVSTEMMSVWDRFAVEEKDGFDLVLYDMGPNRERHLHLDAVVRMTHPGGLILIDDCHKTRYREHLSAFFASHPSIDVLDLRNLTIDEYGRYTWVARVP